MAEPCLCIRAGDSRQERRERPRQDTSGTGLPLAEGSFEFTPAVLDWMPIRRVRR